jgi:hypothetical protein
LWNVTECELTQDSPTFVNFHLCIFALFLARSQWRAGRPKPPLQAANRQGRCARRQAEKIFIAWLAEHGADYFTA